MKQIFAVLSIMLTLTGCGPSGIQSQDGRSPTPSNSEVRGQSTVSNAKSNESAVSIPELSNEEKKSIRDAVRDGIYKGDSEDVVYDSVLKSDMFYTYIAFLEMFPASSHKKEIEAKLARFRKFECPTNDVTTFTFEEMKTRFKWDGVSTMMGRWNKDYAAVVRGRLWGSFTFGNLQVKGKLGVFQGEDGIQKMQFEEGTWFIYPYPSGKPNGYIYRAASQTPPKLGPKEQKVADQKKVAEKSGCAANLRQLDEAKAKWAAENKKTDGDVAFAVHIVEYLKAGKLPECPSGGTYTFNPVGKRPQCSIHGTDY